MELAAFNLIRRIIARAVASRLVSLAHIFILFLSKTTTRANPSPSRSSRKRHAEEPLRIVRQVSRRRNREPGRARRARIGGGKSRWGEREKERDKEKIRRAPNIDGTEGIDPKCTVLRPRSVRCLVVLPHRHTACANRLSARARARCSA